MKRTAWFTRTANSLHRSHCLTNVLRHTTTAWLFARRSISRRHVRQPAKCRRCVGPKCANRTAVPNRFGCGKASRTTERPQTPVRRKSRRILKPAYLSNRPLCHHTPRILQRTVRFPARFARLCMRADPARGVHQKQNSVRLAPTRRVSCRATEPAKSSFIGVVE
jgi:hypothetical protein